MLKERLYVRKEKPMKTWDVTAVIGTLFLLAFGACQINDDEVCQRNETNACQCPNEKTGVQVCSEDLQGWEPCDCGDSSGGTGDAGASEESDSGESAENTGEADAGGESDSGGSSGSGDFLPVTNAYVITSSKAIARFTVDSEANLRYQDTVIPGETVTAVRLNHSGRNLYAAGPTGEEETQTVYAYKVEENGSLAEQTSVTIPHGDLSDMAITPFPSDPNFLYATFSVAGTAAVHAVGLNGTTLSDAGDTALGNFWPVMPYVHPEGHCFYVHQKSPDLLKWSTIDRATGALTVVESLVVSIAGMYGKPTLVSPAGTYLYSAGSDGVYFIQVDPETCALSNFRMFQTMPTWAPRDLAVHPSSNWLYVSGDDGYIHRFSISDGAPTNDIAFASDPSVERLKVASSDILISVSPAEGRIVSWQIDGNGLLTKASTETVVDPSRLDVAPLP
jgi:6-phosphogluconolactonase (cycloisomerase 2 family)